MKCLATSLTALVFLACSQATAQDWAQKMFAQSRHDFGTVARDSKTEFEFTFQNVYQEEVRIAGVRSSCGCTTPILKDDKRTYKSWEKGAIIAHVNSDLFRGRKGATLTVTFDKPFYAEAQVQVSVFIRDDVVLNPGSLHFGAVEQGNPAVVRLAVGAYNRPGWQIAAVKSDNPHLEAEVAEARRDAGQTVYHLTVRLGDGAPAGDLREHVRLVTNDPQQPELPVLVEGRVLSAVTIGPRLLSLGVVKPGDKVTRQVVVRAKEPFRITAIEAEGPGFEFPAGAGQQAKAVHVVPVTFTAGDQPGSVHQTIRIQTDLEGATAEFAAHAVVGAEGAAHEEPAAVTSQPADADIARDSQANAGSASQDLPRNGPLARAARSGRTPAGRGW